VNDLKDLPRVTVSHTVLVSRMFKWARDQGLIIGQTWFFLGYSDRNTKLTFCFTSKDKAMLFKLSWGGS
jgi:hypothetical protein